MNTYRNDLMIEAGRRERGIARRERLRNDAAAAFAVSSAVVFVFLLAQLVDQIVGAMA